MVKEMVPSSSFMRVMGMRTVLLSVVILCLMTPMSVAMRGMLEWFAQVGMKIDLHAGDHHNILFVHAASIAILYNFGCIHIR